MNLFTYIAIVTSLISFNYALAFLVATWAVLNNFYLPYDYLEKLLIISQFSFSVKIFFNIFSQANISRINHRRLAVNMFEAWGGILFTLFAIFWFDIGLYMDISNVGVGSFLSSMINDLFIVTTERANATS